jgi:hypothetical protein
MSMPTGPTGEGIAISLYKRKRFLIGGLSAIYRLFIGGDDTIDI